MAGKGLPGSLVVQALSGYAFLNGDRGRAPLKAPGHILGYACGVSAFVAALAVLVSRLESGRGRFVEASEMETLTAILPLLRIEYTGMHPEREGGPSTGVRAHRCCDGWVTFIPPPDDQLGEYEAALGIEEDEWPPLVEGEDLEKRRRKLLPLAGKVRDKAADEVFHRLARRRVVCGKVASPADLLADEHLAARGFFGTLHHPHLGDLPFAGPPATLSCTHAVAPQSAPPVDEELDALALDRRLGETPAPGVGEPDALPLEGVRIIDLTQAWIGPFAVMLLADLGAEVVKVESHNRPDVWRRWVADPFPAANRHAAVENSSPLFNSVNRNKRSLCLDLKTAKGLELLRRLIADADVVMENYTPHVMSKFGLEWPELARTNASLVTGRAPSGLSN